MWCGAKEGLEVAPRVCVGVRRGFPRGCPEMTDHHCIAWCTADSLACSTLIFRAVLAAWLSPFALGGCLAQWLGWLVGWLVGWAGCCPRKILFTWLLPRAYFLLHGPERFLPTCQLCHD
jgi:hypothetical protein